MQYTKVEQISYSQVTPIDRSGLISLLPGFLFFTTSLIAGSKALSGKHPSLSRSLSQCYILSSSFLTLSPPVVPIPVFVAVYNTLPAAVYLLERLLPGGAQVTGHTLESRPCTGWFFFASPP